jgi:hypothetical protein
MSDTWVAIVLWIHLMAIVTWLGLIVNSAFAFFPALKILPPAARADTLAAYQRKALLISVVAVVVLGIAGTVLVLTQASNGTMSPMTDPWTRLIAIKHVLIGAMLVLQLFALLSIQPSLIRALREIGNAPDALKTARLNTLANWNRAIALATSLLGFGVLAIIAFVVTFY